MFSSKPTSAEAKLAVAHDACHCNCMFKWSVMQYFTVATILCEAHTSTQVYTAVHVFHFWVCMENSKYTSTHIADINMIKHSVSIFDNTL